MKSLAIALDRGQSRNGLGRLLMLGVSFGLVSGLAQGEESVPTPRTRFKPSHSDRCLPSFS